MIEAEQVFLQEQANNINIDYSGRTKHINRPGGQFQKDTDSGAVVSAGHAPQVVNDFT